MLAFRPSYAFFVLLILVVALGAAAQAIAETGHATPHLERPLIEAQVRAALQQDIAAKAKVTTWFDADGLAQGECLAVASEHWNGGLRARRVYLSCGLNGAQILSDTTYAVETEYGEETALVLRTGSVAGLELPDSPEDALRMWQEAVPNIGALVWTLERFPADRALERALVVGLAKSGPLECSETVEEYGCDSSYYRWKGVDGVEGMDDPCVRRQIVVSALRGGLLTQEDISSLMNALIPAIASSPPHDDVGQALLTASAGWSDEGMRLSVLERVVSYTVSEEHLKGLSQKALRRLYHRSASYSVLHMLSATPDNLLVFNDAVKRRTDPIHAIKQLAQIPGADADSALMWLIQHGNCREASEAAAMLEKRGHKQFAPELWPQTTSPEALGRFLCMASHREPDVQLAFWKQVLPQASFTVEFYGETSSIEGEVGLKGLISEHYQLRDTSPGTATKSADGSLTIDLGDAVLELKKRPDGGWGIESVVLSEGGCGC